MENLITEKVIQKLEKTLSTICGKTNNLNKLFKLDFEKSFYGVLSYDLFSDDRTSKTTLKIVSQLITDLYTAISQKELNEYSIEQIKKITLIVLNGYGKRLTLSAIAHAFTLARMDDPPFDEKVYVVTERYVLSLLSKYYRKQKSIINEIVAADHKAQIAAAGVPSKKAVSLADFVERHPKKGEALENMRRLVEEKKIESVTAKESKAEIARYTASLAVEATSDDVAAWKAEYAALPDNEQHGLETYLNYKKNILFNRNCKKTA